MEEYDFDDPGEFGRDDKDDENFEIQPDPQPNIFEEKPAVHAALRKLQTFYNDTPEFTTTHRSLRYGRDLTQAKSGREEESAISMSNFLFDNVALLAGSDGVLDMVEPTTFQKSWNHPDPIQRKKLRTDIRKEFHDMNDRKVCRKIKISEMPPDRRCLKNKWVFKIKRNGIFRARLVACGYSQIYGVYYMENYAPVMNNVTRRVLLIVMLLKKYDGKILDIEVAFLHGNLEEEIYTDCPQGLEDAKEEECVKLLHILYVLVQSARQFWKKLVNGLKNMGFKGG